MAFLELEDIEVKEPVPGYRGRFVHSEKMTLAYWATLGFSSTAASPARSARRP